MLFLDFNAVICFYGNFLALHLKWQENREKTTAGYK